MFGSVSKDRFRTAAILAVLVLGSPPLATAADDKDKKDAIPTCDEKIGGLLGGRLGKGALGAFTAAGASSYANTEIGQVVAMADLDAYKKLVVELQKNTPNAKADNVALSVTMAKPGRMYTSAEAKSKVVRDLDAG